MLGFGLPTAIGAALACPERTVICFSGEGSTSRIWLRVREDRRHDAEHEVFLRLERFFTSR